MSAPVGGPGRDRDRDRDRDEKHRSWDELAVGWALHALEPEDETLFTDHLAGCARCARTVAETTEVMTAMASDLPQAEPSAALRERLRAAVEEAEQLPPATRRTEPRAVPAALPPGGDAEDAPLAGGREFDGPRAPLPVRVEDPRPAWRRVLPTALVAAAVAAVLSLGAWIVVVTGDRDAAQATAAEQQHMLNELLAPGRATIAPMTEGGRAVATVVARASEVKVVASGLPVNDSHDSTYVVWGMQDGRPQALGTFDVVTPRLDMRPVGSSTTGLNGYSAYGISLEHGRQAPSSPTEMVGYGEVTS